MQYAVTRYPGTVSLISLTLVLQWSYIGSFMMLKPIFTIVNANELRHTENEKIELNVKANNQKLSHYELP